MNILGIEPDDVKKRLNPTNSPNGFLGVNSRVDESDVEESISEGVDTVISRVTARYGGLTEHVDGEILVRSALGGETALQLGLYPATNVRLWVSLDGPWETRRAADCLRQDAGCTVDSETGVVTLNRPLTVDDFVAAEYDHTATRNCHLLRRIAVDLIAVEWARRLYPDDQHFERYHEWQKNAWIDLARMQRKDGERMGIRMFDRLRLIDETQAERMVGGGELDSGGGML